MEWGGTGFNFGADLPRLDSYITSTERMRKLAALRKAGRGPNPFVLAGRRSSAY